VSTATRLLVLAAALGSAVVAGVFGTFSGFVMRALGDLPPATGAAAMQAVNVTALRPPLMTALFGTAALGIAAAVAVLVDRPGALAVALVVAGAAAYLVGAIVVTVAANVPLNEQLAHSVPGGPGTDAVWASYLQVWTRWNTVRAVACTGAAAALGTAPLLGR
jgi:uncharacterized membrane protein